MKSVANYFLPLILSISHCSSIVICSDQESENRHLGQTAAALLICRFPLCELKLSFWDKNKSPPTACCSANQSCDRLASLCQRFAATPGLLQTAAWRRVLQLHAKMLQPLWAALCLRGHDGAERTAFLHSGSEARHNAIRLRCSWNRSSKLSPLSSSSFCRLFSSKFFRMFCCHGTLKDLLPSFFLLFVSPRWQFRYFRLLTSQTKSLRINLRQN